MQRTVIYSLGVVAVCGLLLAVLLLTAAVIGTGVPAAGGDGTPAPHEPGAGPIGMIEIHAFDLGFEPSRVEVAEPGRYEVVLVNDGGAVHDITFSDGTVVLADGRQTARGEVTIPEGGLTFVCSIPGHSDAGMRGEVTITGHAGHGSPSPGASLSPEEMAAEDAAVTARFPEESRGRGGALLEPRIAADGASEFELTASVIEWETVQGSVLEAYAYNAAVPGPEIRVQLGDHVRITLHNELPVPTTLHLHGLILPNEMDGVPGITQDAILPGASFTYEFVARNAGSNMYHSHFMAQRQVPMGLLGAFIVADPEADPVVDADYTMILNDGPLGYTINGKEFPATEPIVATQGETIRIRYMNEGLQIHPMHLHGIPQLVIARDGHLLEHPYTEDTVLVAPGQRVDVLVEASEIGAWAFHCHVLTHAEGDHGMFGMVTAMVVQEP